jgi:hypothetical protein
MYSQPMCSISYKEYNRTFLEISKENEGNIIIFMQ